MTIAPQTWGLPPTDLTLPPDQVHVWCLSLRQSQTVVEQLHSLLSPDEQQRAARFHFSKDQQAFIVARGWLRVLLGRYLRLPPENLRFSYNPYGKPILAEPDGHSLQFNVSHSHELVLYGITRDRALGIDLEYIRADFASAEIAEAYFSTTEKAALRSLPPQLQPEGFFNAWTRKEAYLKAIGQGLSLPLDQFDVSLTPGEPAALLAVRAVGQTAEDWSLQHLIPAPGYVGAIAVAGQGWQLTCWQPPGLNVR